MTVLNGRSAGDTQGEYTFVRSSGHSVIDYGVAAGNWLEMIVDFKVESKTFSEHMPLETSVNTNICSSVLTTQLNLPPKLKWKESLLLNYQQRLNTELAQLHESSPDPVMEDLLDIIVKVAPRPTNLVNKQRHEQKKGWFDRECENARNLSFSLLSSFRSLNNSCFKILYVEANKNYKTLCLQKKKDYNMRMVNSLLSARSSADFWKSLKSVNGVKPIIACQLKASVLKNYFSSLLNTECIASKFHYASPLIENELLDSDFSEKELQFALHRAKNNKAAGTDRIPSEFFKYASTNYLSSLLKCYNVIFESTAVPSTFLSSVIFPLFKKGDPSVPNNYRGISFLNAAMKLFTSMLFSRLTEWVSDKQKLSELQAGFRSGYSTTDQVFLLTNIAELHLHQGKKLYAFFIDFKAAFDSIDREALFYKLSNIGVSTKVSKILRALYAKDCISVWDGDSVSDDFSSSMGLKQGCALSTLLFTLFIDDLVEHVGGGVKISDETVPGLLYADDIVLFAESPKRLQQMIMKLEAYCGTWNLSVNLEKSNILIFRKGHGRYSREEKWNFQRQEIKIVKEFKYLGVIITSNLCMEKHVKAKLQEAKAALCISWKNCIANKAIHHSTKYRLFQAVAKSIMLYSAQVWGYKEYEDVEKSLRFFLKRVFSLPSTTPNYMLHIETGLPPLFIDTLKAHFDYVLKILKMSSSRLIKRVLEYLISNQLNFVGVWFEISSNLDERLELNLENLTVLKQTFYQLLNKLDEKIHQSFINKAQASQYREFYSNLQFELGPLNYFNDKNPTDMISLILRARGEILPLNFIPHRPDLPIECEICNMRVRENVAHFLGSCPILQEIRLGIFGKNQLTPEEVIQILNGAQGWENLYKFVRLALSYRKRIVTERF